MSSGGDTADRTGGALPSADLDQPVAINVEDRLGLGALELIESAQARWLAVNAPTSSRWSEPAQDSRTANSSNDPTSQEVKLKSRDTLIHTC